MCAVFPHYFSSSPNILSFNSCGIECAEPFAAFNNHSMLRLFQVLTNPATCHSIADVESEVAAADLARKFELILCHGPEFVVKVNELRCVCVHVCVCACMHVPCEGALYVCTNDVLQGSCLLFLMQRKPAAGTVPVSNVSGW